MKVPLHSTGDAPRLHPNAAAALGAPGLAALLVFALACAAGCPSRQTGAAAAEQASAAGKRPRRIVSLVPATTEMLFAMGAGDRLVGIGSYDRHPPESDRLPRLGGLLDPNVERLLALKPDLAIVYDTQTGLKRQLARAGVAIVPYLHGDLSDITRLIRSLGARIGVQEQAGVLASSIDRRLDASRARVAGRPRPRTLLVFGREPGALRNVEASGGYGFLHDMIEIAGGANVAGDVKRESVRMSTETILARAPDVIVELHYGLSMAPERLVTERRVWNQLPAVPAVRNNRVYLLVGDEFVVPGPRIAEATERLSRAIHPEAWPSLPQ